MANSFCSVVIRHEAACALAARNRVTMFLLNKRSANAMRSAGLSLDVYQRWLGRRREIRGARFEGKLGTEEGRCRITNFIPYLGCLLFVGSANNIVSKWSK